MLEDLSIELPLDVVPFEFPLPLVPMTPSLLKVALFISDEANLRSAALVGCLLPQ